MLLYHATSRPPSDSNDGVAGTGDCATCCRNAAGSRVACGACRFCRKCWDRWSVHYLFLGPQNQSLIMFSRAKQTHGLRCFWSTTSCRTSQINKVASEWWIQHVEWVAHNPTPGALWRERLAIFATLCTEHVVLLSYAELEKSMNKNESRSKISLAYIKRDGHIGPMEELPHFDVSRHNSRNIKIN